MAPWGSGDIAACVDEPGAQRLQAMPPRESITIAARLRPTDREAVLPVSDTGVGLPADDLKRLGEPFFTKRAGGIDLGCFGAPHHNRA